MKLSSAFLAVAVCTGMMFAQTATTTSTTTTTTKMSKTMVMKIMGHVISVDAMTNTLIIKTAKKEDTLSVTMETKIMSAGNAIPLGDLKTGEKVKVEYKKEEGKMMAIEIKVVPSGSVKKAEPVEKKY